MRESKSQLLVVLLLTGQESGESIAKTVRGEKY